MIVSDGRNPDKFLANVQGLTTEQLESLKEFEREKLLDRFLAENVNALE